ncbi:2-hydroxy-3-keto-5-methylthiopentenyl-1-phosphate phosphatase [Caldicoprobacter guelmensis]|uniref:MtnX-like HAD-IB family phosphatase n=1 Tax=Caldicoprobacter guelmensis TaxID=1170224 RepID=UPI00195F18F8|nr:2-hydroxy-3-keto-5-methylthiopentenyl-1-phosphate phosphatase [Caldicoprobacter guelmensis]
MNKSLNSLNSVAIVSDFDGTITDVDTNDLIYFTFGGRPSYEVEELIAQGKLGVKEGALQHFKRIHLTEQEFLSFIFKNARLDEGFKDFCKLLNKKGIPLIIVSGGYINTISSFLEKEGIDRTNIRIYANRLKFNGCHIEVVFFDDKDECESGLGPCGNCKLKRLRELKKRYYHIIFIGDGTTDRCAAREADLVFAKGRLKDYCAEQGIQYVPFDSFYDIIQAMFKNHFKRD